MVLCLFPLCWVCEVRFFGCGWLVGRRSAKEVLCVGVAIFDKAY